MMERGLPVVMEENAEREKEGGLSSSWKGAHGGVAVVKMGHFIGAQNFAGGMLALVRMSRSTSASEGGKMSLPAKPGPNGIVASEVNVVENGTVENNGEEANAASTTGEEPLNNGSDKPIESQYTPEEEKNHFKTLTQLSSLHVHHLFNHFIPHPIPPDMTIPQSYPTPADPNVPFHLLEALTALRLRYEQSIIDAEVTAKEGNALSTSVSYLNDEDWGGHAAAAGDDDGTNTNTNNNNDNSEIGSFKMDKAKIAAAAGGAGYDEDADPLNAPDVVLAVLAFKRNLENLNAKGKTRRVDIITERMGKKVKELLEVGRRERLENKRRLREEEERQRQMMQIGQQPGEQVQQLQGQMQQHVVEGGNAPSVEDTGRRGVSNLPAWMTNGNASGTATDANQVPSEAAADDDDTGADGKKKRKFVPSEANRDINVRKPRLDVEGGQSLSEIRAANEAADKEQAASATEPKFAVQTTKEGILSSGSKFPPLPSTTTAVDSLKKYVTAQIIDYLGEEESTLIEFIMKELQKESGCTTVSLLEEMKVVLDEDAEDFVLALYRKMVE